jgi:hypothetical protein
MKRISYLIISLAFVFSISNIFAQNAIKGISPAQLKKAGTYKLKQQLKAHKPTGAANYAFLDYPIDDSLLAAGHYSGGTFLGSPSIGQFYVQEMNMHYTMSDSGADVSGQPANVLLIHNCAVAFDTLLDATTGMGYAPASVSGVTVDSLYIPIAQSNASGKNDTLVVQIVSVSATGTPTTTVLWSQSLIQDTGFSGVGNLWSTTIGVLALNPKLTLASGSKFAVVLNYYDESKKDTCAFLWGAPGYNCTLLGGDIPDTTMIGTNIKITGGGHIRANSFTSGYNYFTGSKPSNSNPLISLPSATYGDAFAYDCTPDTTVGLYWQDIAIFAEVSFTTSPTGLNNIADAGFSVAQNYPNPFNKTTQITYNLANASDISFNVYDMTGRKLISNSYTDAAPGQHVITLNANQFTPGVYFYTFDVNGTSVTKKMVITE